MRAGGERGGGGAAACIAAAITPSPLVFFGGPGASASLAPPLWGGVRSLAPSIPAEVRVIAAGPCAAGEAGRARSGGSKASIAAVEMGCGGGAGLVAATVVGAGGAVAVGCVSAAA